MYEGNMLIHSSVWFTKHPQADTISILLLVFFILCVYGRMFLY